MNGNLEGQVSVCTLGRAGPVIITRKLHEAFRSAAQRREAGNRREGQSGTNTCQEQWLRRFLASGSSKWEKAP